MMSRRLILGLALAAGFASEGRAMELLANAILDTPNAPPGWELQEFSTSLNGGLGGGIDSAEQAGFFGGTGRGDSLWLKAWTGLFAGNGNERSTAILSQSKPAVVGENYTFFGESLFEGNFSGGVTTLAPTSPSGAVPSPTNTYFELGFYDSLGAVIGVPTRLDLRTVQTNGGGWATHSLAGVAPVGAATVRVTAASEDMIPNIDPQQSAFVDTFSLRAASAPTVELLDNAAIDILPPALPSDWTVATDETGGFSYFAGFAAHAGANGLYIDNTGADINPEDYVLTQTVAGTPGATYEFSGWSYFYGGYSGGVDTLSADSPFGAVPSLTETTYVIEFLDGSSTVLSSASVELKDAGQMNDNTWRQHSVVSTAPAGTANVRVSLKALDLMANINPPGDFQGANFDDFSLTIQVAQFPGDANGDGTVDLLDLDILGANFGSSPATFSEGDFNNDNAVDLLDLDILGANFGMSAPGSALAVPEPVAVTLLGSLALACGSARRR